MKDKFISSDEQLADVKEREEAKGLNVVTRDIYEKNGSGKYSKVGFLVSSVRQYARTFTGANSEAVAMEWAENIVNSQMTPLYNADGEVTGHIVTWY